MDRDRPKGIQRWSMRLALAALLSTGGFGAIASERQLADGGGPWCHELESLQPYIEALLAGDRAVFSSMRDCEWLSAGTVVDLTDDAGSVPGALHLVKVRIRDRPAGEGYTVSSVLDTFHRPDTSTGGR